MNRYYTIWILIGAGTLSVSIFLTYGVGWIFAKAVQAAGGWCP